jgi:hypothetical protein
MEEAWRRAGRVGKNPMYVHSSTLLEIIDTSGFLEFNDLLSGVDYVAVWSWLINCESILVDNIILFFFLTSDRSCGTCNQGWFSFICCWYLDFSKLYSLSEENGNREE